MTLIRRPVHRITVRRAATDHTRVEDISSEVLTIRTVKAFEQPAGTFTLETTFRPSLDGKPLHEALKPNDLVLIELKADYQDRWVPVMIGLVDRASRRLQMVGERAIREGQIVGRDLGKLLITHQVIWWQFATTDPFLRDWQQRLAAITDIARPTPFGSPDQIIEEILEHLFFRKATLPVRLRGDSNPDVRRNPPVRGSAGTDYWRNWMTFTRLPEKDGYNHAKFSPGETVFGWLETDAVVWNLITAYADQPWNQVWTDTGDDGKFHIYFRPTPYPSHQEGRVDWDLVPEYQPPAREAIIGENLGLSDHDRTNFFFTKLTMHNLFNRQEFAIATIVPETAPIEDDTDFHGQLPLIKESIYMTDLSLATRVPMGEGRAEKDDQSTVPILKMLRLKSGLLRDWFRLNHTYESGTITLIGDPSVRVGQRFFHPRNRMEYLILGVRQDYSFAEHRYTTTLNVARGSKRA
jgi:hypothetical protein